MTFLVKARKVNNKTKTFFQIAQLWWSEHAVGVGPELSYGTTFQWSADPRAWFGCVLLWQSLFLNQLAQTWMKHYAILGHSDC